MCILVAEDEPLIRAILVEELEDAGYEVCGAASGDDAVDALPGLSKQPRLLVTDIHMPGSRDGIALAAYMRDRFPTIPVIYTTGQPDALSFLRALPEKDCLIRKPYKPQEIIDKVSALLTM